MEATVYHLPEKEVHMLGDYVGIVWNTKRTKKTLRGEDGLTYTAVVPVRDGQPYIDFLLIRGVDDTDPQESEAWEDEDSPVDGGLDAQQALQVSRELALAVEYLKTVSG